MDQRGVAAPVLGRGVDEHHLGYATLLLETSEHRAGFAGDRVGLLGVGKGEELGYDVADVLGRLPETQVELAPHPAGDVGHYAVEGHPSLLVVVQPRVNELPEEAAALRRPEGVGVLDVPGARISVLLRRVLQEGHDVSDRGEAQAYHGAAARRVDQLVEPPGLETLGHEDVAGLGLHIPVLHAHEGPLLASDLRGRPVGVVAHGERRGRVVYIRRRVRQVLSVREQENLGEVVGLELAEDSALESSVLPKRLGRVQPDETGRRRNVGLPAAPDHCIAVPHQKAVARIERVRRVEEAGGAVEAAQHGFAPAVDNVEQNASVAPIGIFRAKHREG